MTRATSCLLTATLSLSSPSTSPCSRSAIDKRSSAALYVYHCVQTPETNPRMRLLSCPRMSLLLGASRRLFSSAPSVTSKVCAPSPCAATLRSLTNNRAHAAYYLLAASFLRAGLLRHQHRRLRGWTRYHRPLRQRRPQGEKCA